MAGVYSRRFLIGKVNSAPTAAALTYTVPTGFVAVVRNVDIYCDVASTVVLIGRKLTNDDVFFAGSTGVAAGVVAHWEGRQVFNAGDVMYVLWSSGTGRLMVSGYLLTAT